MFCQIDVKCPLFIQSIQCKQYLFAFQYPNKRISVILCGDFNSVPSCGIYQLYTTGASPSSLPDWKSSECKINKLCNKFLPNCRKGI